jgi:hypothetical protein
VLSKSSPLLDLKTLGGFASTHPATFRIKAGRVLEARFENILLPDSTINSVKSNGSLTFTITPVSTLQVGQSVQNTASIYFDYNTPVKTNEVSSLYRMPLATVAPAPARAPWFPNPTTALVSLRVDKEPHTALYAIDASGKAHKVLYTYQAKHVIVNLQPLGAGLFTLRFSDESNMGRVLVQR